MPKPIIKDKIKPRAKPALTRREDQPITPNTDKNEPPEDKAPALVPPGSKKRNWSLKLLRNMCGGGNRIGLAQPCHQANSHKPTKIAIDVNVHNTVEK